VSRRGSSMLQQLRRSAYRGGPGHSCWRKPRVLQNAAVGVTVMANDSPLRTPSLQESDIILALSVGDDLSRMIPTKSIRTKMLAGMRGSEAAGIEMPSQRKRLSRRTRRGAVEPSTYSPFCRQSRFRPPSFRRSGQYDPVLRQQRRRGEDEENPRSDLVTGPLTPTERQVHVRCTPDRSWCRRNWRWWWCRRNWKWWCRRNWRWWWCRRNWRS
jgi:hypothetical protein